VTRSGFVVESVTNTVPLPKSEPGWGDSQSSPLGAVTGSAANPVTASPI